MPTALPNRDLPGDAPQVCGSGEAPDRLEIDRAVLGYKPHRVDADLADEVHEVRCVDPGQASDCLAVGQLFPGRLGRSSAINSYPGRDEQRCCPCAWIFPGAPTPMRRESLLPGVGVWGR